MMRYFKNRSFLFAGILFLAAAWKSVFLAMDVIPFDSDEAVVGLMARHILRGERPLFFYGQAYMGSLDAFLIAGFFTIFGQQVWCIRLVQLILYLGTVATTMLLGRQVSGSWKTGILAGLFMAFPTVNVTLYTTASLGGYGEALLLGNLILLLAFSAARQLAQANGPRCFAWLSAAWGFLVGLGLWANGLTLVYSAPAGLFLLWKIIQQRKGWIPLFLGSAAAGFLIGSQPWWLYAVTHGLGQPIIELFGNQFWLKQDPWLVRTGKHLINFLLLGVSVILGMRPPWSVEWLGLPLMPAVLAFWLGVGWFTIRKLRSSTEERPGYLVLLGVGGVLLAGFLFTGFGIDPTGRYFLPLSIPMSVFAAVMIASITRRNWQAALLVALVLGYNMWGTLSAGLRFPPGLTTQFYEPTRIDHRADADLMDFLRQEGETRGYSNYWVAYTLAFISDEEIIFIPRLPYHLDLHYTPSDDAYPAYTEQVTVSEKVAYITTHNPKLDQHLRTAFSAIGVTWQEKKIGDYQIYYALSRAVRPQEVGLGELSE